MHTKKLLVLALYVGAALAVPDYALAADARTFVYRTLIDATPVGGEPNTPLKVTYSFPANLVADPVADEYDPHLQFGATYLPITLTIEIDGQSVEATEETSINVMNDGGLDAYDVRVANFDILYGGPGVVDGTLYGMEVSFFYFQVIDSTGTMLQNAHLPLSANFASRADRSATGIELFDPATGEFVFLLGTDVPEAITPFSLEVEQGP